MRCWNGNKKAATKQTGHVPVGDAKAFAAAMERIASDSTFAETLGKEAKKTRISHAETRIIANYFDYIEKILVRTK